MARQNFHHSKRQRDLAKKQKREEKQQRKAERKKQAQEEPETPVADPVPPEAPTSLEGTADRVERFKRRYAKSST